MKQLFTVLGKALGESRWESCEQAASLHRRFATQPAYTQARPERIPGAVPTFPTKHKSILTALKPRNKFYPECTGPTITMIELDEKNNTVRDGENI